MKLNIKSYRIIVLPLDNSAPIGNQSDIHDTRLRRQRMESQIQEEIIISDDEELSDTDHEEGEVILENY